MRQLIKVKKGKKVHLAYGRGFNSSLCKEPPPFEVLQKGTVNCKKCKEAKDG